MVDNQAPRPEQVLRQQAPRPRAGGRLQRTTPTVQRRRRAARSEARERAAAEAEAFVREKKRAGFREVDGALVKGTVEDKPRVRIELDAQGRPVKQTTYTVAGRGNAIRGVPKEIVTFNPRTSEPVRREVLTLTAAGGVRKREIFDETGERVFREAGMQREATPRTDARGRTPQEALAQARADEARNIQIRQDPEAALRSLRARREAQRGEGVASLLPDTKQRISDLLRSQVVEDPLRQQTVRLRPEDRVVVQDLFRQQTRFLTEREKEQFRKGELDADQTRSGPMTPAQLPTREEAIRAQEQRRLQEPTIFGRVTGQIQRGAAGVFGERVGRETAAILGVSPVAALDATTQLGRLGEIRLRRTARAEEERGVTFTPTAFAIGAETLRVGTSTLQVAPFAAPFFLIPGAAAIGGTVGSAALTGVGAVGLAQELVAPDPTLSRAGRRVRLVTEGLFAATPLISRGPRVSLFRSRVARPTTSTLSRAGTAATASIGERPAFVTTVGLDFGTRGFPLVTRAPGRLVLGRRNVFGRGDAPLTPETPIPFPSRRSTGEGLLTLIDDPVQVQRVREAREIVSLGRSTRRRTDDFIFNIEEVRQPERTAPIIEEFLVRQRTPITRQEPFVFGSFVQQTQLRGTGFAKQTIGDIDVVLPIKTAKAKPRVEELGVKLREAGEDVRISRENPLIIEFRESGEKFLEFKTPDAEALGLAEPAAPGFFGFLFQDRLVGVGRAKQITIGEQLSRKGAAVSFFSPGFEGFRGPAFLPKEQRFKDLPDFVAAARGVGVLQGRTRGARIEGVTERFLSTFDVQQRRTIEEAIDQSIGGRVLLRGERQSPGLFSAASPSPARSPEISRSPSPAQAFGSISIGSPSLSPSRQFSPSQSPIPSRSRGPSPSARARSVSSQRPSPSRSPFPSPVPSPSPSLSPSRQFSPSPRPSPSPSPSPSPFRQVPARPVRGFRFGLDRGVVEEEKKGRSLRSRGRYAPSLLGIALVEAGAEQALARAPRTIVGLNIRLPVRGTGGFRI